jgi:crotonobetainyl-CoA:carnitine CoA-transferase CaiB-like acyl-CoA transferase
VALSDNEIRRLEAVLGITILDDPGFAAHDRRMQNSYELADAVSGVLSERDSEEWVRLLRSAGVAAMIPKAMSNDASFHRDSINQAIAGSPRWRAAAAAHRLALELGADTDAVLREHGYSPEKIAELRGRGTIK